MTEKQARETLYRMWENGQVPPNFTEDHSNYSIALMQLQKHGHIICEELF